jgi:hypothetical protein
MEGSERDRTEDWQLPESARPPTIAQLQQRIDEALATARATESAVTTVGAAALDAAERAGRAAKHAQRSAELAEWASAAMLGDPSRGPRAGAAVDDDLMRSFSEHADRVVARLRALERLPLPVPR